MCDLKYFFGHLTFRDMSLRNDIYVQIFFVNVVLQRHVKSYNLILKLTIHKIITMIVITEEGSEIGLSTANNADEHMIHSKMTFPNVL